MTTAISLLLALMLSIGGSPAGGPGDTGIQAPIDNSCAINPIFKDYTQKTASRADSKKILEIVSIEQPKTQTRLSFQLCPKEKLYLVGYEDSMNLYQAFNMNPINFTDPFGLFTDYYWEAKENRIRKRGPIIQNPADEMTRSALIQHGKSTARNAALVGIAQIPVVGKPFVAGYAVRQVGEGYIGCVKGRWNDVSVFDSGAKSFFKKATSPFTGLWDLIFGGPKKMYGAVTDESLSGKEIGTSLMEGYDQTAWTAVGGYYGYKLIKNKIQYRGLGDSTTSPWLNDSRVGIGMHLEEFRKGGSFLLTKDQYEFYVKNNEFVGDPTGQFITTKAAMDKLFEKANGNIRTIEKLLGFDEGYYQRGNGLVRIDIKNPLLHNVRFPTGFERGANANFRWGGYTSGGMPEAIIDLIPNNPHYVIIKNID